MNEFDMLIKTVTLGDEIGHMFMVDIRLDHRKGDAKKLMHNKLYIHIFEKQKTSNPMKKPYSNFLKT